MAPSEPIMSQSWQPWRSLNSLNTQFHSHTPHHTQQKKFVPRQSQLLPVHHNTTHTLPTTISSAPLNAHTHSQRDIYTLQCIFTAIAQRRHRLQRVQCACEDKPVCPRSLLLPVESNYPPTSHLLNNLRFLLSGPPLLDPLATDFCTHTLPHISLCVRVCVRARFFAASVIVCVFVWWGCVCVCFLFLLFRAWVILSVQAQRRRLRTASVAPFLPDCLWVAIAQARRWATHNDNDTHLHTHTHTQAIQRERDTRIS